MSVSSYQRHEHKGIRTNTCPDCDGSGLEGDSGEGFWEMSACPKCNGSGEFYACVECGENAQECDETCHHCYAALFITGPEVYDPNETAPGGDRLWDRPGFREAEQLITAAMAARNAA